MTDRTFVLDASAVLALLQGEMGADQVEPMLDGAVMSSVNLCEVLQKAEQHDVDTEGLEYDLQALGVDFRAFDLPDARATAERWVPKTGSSLGDRACLALALRVDGTAVTTEHGWIATAPDVSVAAIR